MRRSVAVALVHRLVELLEKAVHHVEVCEERLGERSGDPRTA